MKIRTIVAVAVLLGSATAEAGGYIVSEVGSRTSGRATAAVGMIDTPAAIYFNPGNVALLPGLQLEATANVLMPQWQYTRLESGAPTEESDFGTSVPPALSLTYNFGDMGFGDLAAGLGVYVPYGSTLAWPDGWTGRTDLRELDLRVFEITPVVGLRPHKMVSVGFGLRYLPSQVYLKRAVDFAGQAEGEVELAGPGDAFGFSAGVTVLPVEGLVVGLGWRSATTLRFQGDSNFKFPAPFDTAADDRDVEAEIPAPQVLRLGFGYDILPKKLNATIDFEYEMWGTFESLDITFKNDDGTEQTLASERDAQNTLVVHVGGEYKVTEEIAVRAGYAFDPHTIPEHNVNATPPDSDRHLVVIGGSYLFGDYGLHAHFGNVFFAERETTTNALPGIWEGGLPGGTSAYITGLTFSANFGGSSTAMPVETPMEGGAAPMATTMNSMMVRE